MTFVLNGIKEVYEKQYPIAWYVGIDSLIQVKTWAESLGIIILSLKEYTANKRDFGNVYVKSSFGDLSFEIIEQGEKELKDVCMFCLSMGIDVQDMNYLDDPQTQEQINKVISSCKQEILALQKQEQEKEKKVKDEEKNDLTDQQLEKAKSVVAWANEKVTHLLEEKKSYISSKDLKFLKTKQEELKKLRMGTNYEKIKEILEDIMAMIQRIDNAYFDSIEDQISELFPGTVVTDLDVEKEATLLERVRKQREYGGTVSPFEKDYLVFGEKIIYLRFLKKDFFAKLSKFSNILYGAFDFIEFVSLVVIVQLAIFFVVKLLLVDLSTIYDALFFGIIRFARFGILVFVVKYLRKKNVIYLLLLWILLFIFYFVSFTVIKHSFALG